MSYQYLVRDPLGNTHQGNVEAPSIEDARQQLRRDGFQVIELAEAEDDDGVFGRRVSKNDIIYVTSQLSIMVDTGIPLSEALGGMVEQETNPTMRKILAELKTAVEGGEDFSSALARHPKLFDKTFVALVKASEATGTLGTMLDRIADSLRKEVETRGRVRAAMAYPTVMMVLALGVTIFLLTYILPKFVPLFKSKGMELPGPTWLMMSISDALLGYWVLWVGALAMLVVGFLLGRRTEPGRRALDRLKISIPLIGPMYRKVIISRCIRTLGTMIQSGVPFTESIRMTGQVSGNVHYEELWSRVLDQVSGGKRICEVLSGNKLLPNVLVQMISAGEESGKLDQVLQRVSVYFDREVETSIKATTSLIEPIMIAAMGVVVGTIGLALLLPIFSLSRQP